MIATGAHSPIVAQFLLARIANFTFAWQDGHVSVIEVRNLHKNYGSLQAVDGVDLTIERGEIFAILGPNGAGKTTTVEILEGFRRRNSGDVKVLDFDPQFKGKGARDFCSAVPFGGRDRRICRRRKNISAGGSLAGGIFRGWTFEANQF